MIISTFFIYFYSVLTESKNWANLELEVSSLIKMVTWAKKTPTARRVDITMRKIIRRIFRGSGKDIIKPKKTGNPLIDFLNQSDYFFLGLLDRIDTRLLFKGRGVRTEKGRVRSRSERKLIHFFENHNIDYVYEPCLVLDGIKLSPDFYLPQYKVYVEFWGLAYTNARYRRTMHAKKELYRKHNIPVISVYPKQLSDLERKFPVIFISVVGKEFPAKTTNKMEEGATEEKGKD